MPVAFQRNSFGGVFLWPCDVNGPWRFSIDIRRSDCSIFGTQIQDRRYRAFLLAARIYIETTDDNRCGLRSGKRSIQLEQSAAFHRESQNRNRSQFASDML